MSSRKNIFFLHICVVLIENFIAIIHNIYIRTDTHDFNMKSIGFYSHTHVAAPTDQITIFTFYTDDIPFGILCEYDWGEWSVEYAHLVVKRAWAS